MRSDPDNLVLVLLRELRVDMVSSFGRVESVLADHTGQLQRLEIRTTSIDRRLGEVAIGAAEDGDRVNRRLRRLEDAAPRGEAAQRFPRCASTLHGPPPAAAR